MKAIIFPGQGSQYVGMGKGLYDNFSCAKGIFSSIDDILSFKLSEKCFQGTQDELKDTSLQQLAILAVSLAAFEVFRKKEIKIDYLSGLSLGEYSCLYAAGVLGLEDVVILVKKRALAMQKAASASSSTMFAVIGSERKFLKEKAGELDFHVANINSPQQIVISLSKDRKDEIRNNLETGGARVIELAVSGGFHSPFMNQAKESLTEVVEKMEFSDAKIPIVSNVTAQANSQSQAIKTNLLNQMVSCVLWNDCVEFMITQGVDLFFEVGPSKVLRGLMRKINSGVKVNNIERKEDIEQL
jgi:[acyl-carrier-protein] S-malonyltransferase